MIKRIYDEKEANICDELLTLLVLDENKYDKTIDKNFIVKDYFKNVIKNENNILLAYYEQEQIVGYLFLKYIKENDVIGYLFDGLYVKEEYRNKKIAKNLINEALNILKDKEYN